MVSIIMTARERYGMTRLSLLSVLKGLDRSVEVIVVAGKAPADVLAFLEKTAKSRKRFIPVRENRRLWSNESRNLGLERAKKGNDIVFIENDVVARPGWLGHLLGCFRRERADIVAPLVFEGGPQDPDPQCHIAGADFIREGPGKSGPVIGMEHFLNHEKMGGRRLNARRVDVVEFHCLLIRRKLLDRMTLKPKQGGLFGHLDLCLQAEKLRAKIIMEPKAQVVFANPFLSPIKTRPDFDSFIFQWGERESNERLREFTRDWGMDPEKGLLPSFREWVLWNKGLVFATFGTLWGIERLLWRAARFRLCPSWIRRVLERYLAARIRGGTKWKTFEN